MPTTGTSLPAVEMLLYGHYLVVVVIGRHWIPLLSPRARGGSPRPEDLAQAVAKAMAVPRWFGGREEVVKRLPLQFALTLHDPRSGAVARAADASAGGSLADAVAGVRAGRWEKTVYAGPLDPTLRALAPFATSGLELSAASRTYGCCDGGDRGDRFGIVAFDCLSP